jgi:hypothetical protein
MAGQPIALSVLAASRSFCRRDVWCAALISGLTLCAAGWLQPSTARAAAYRLAVLELESDNVHDQLASQLTARLRADIAGRAGYELRDAQVSLVQLSLAQDCLTAEADCLAKIARELDLDGFVFGIVTHEGGTPAAMLRRYDVHAQQVERSALLTLPTRAMSDDEIEQATHKLLDDLLGNSRALTQRLLKLPAPAPASQAAGLDADGGSARTVAAYVLLGSALVSAGMVALSFYEIRAAERDPSFMNYRYAIGDSNPAVSAVCDEAAAGKDYGLGANALRTVKSSCATGSVFEVLQYVFIGSALVTAGIGTYLLVSGDSSQEHAPRSLSLKPNLQRRGVGLTAQLEF